MRYFFFAFLPADAFLFVFFAGAFFVPFFAVFLAAIVFLSRRASGFRAGTSDALHAILHSHDRACQQNPSIFPSLHPPMAPRRPPAAPPAGPGSHRPPPALALTI